MKFPDVEAMVLTFLADRVDAPVQTSVPDDRPDRFVRLWRNGGTSSNRVIDRPQVTVEAWSLDSVDASELAEACRSALLHHASEMSLVRGASEVSGPYSVSDEATESPRYRFTVALTVRATR